MIEALRGKVIAMGNFKESRTYATQTPRSGIVCPPIQVYA